MAEWRSYISSHLSQIARDSLPYVYVIFLSSWGGLVRHFEVARKNKTLRNWRELVFSLLVSSFAGILTYFLCQSAGIDGPKSAFLIGISGHMGVRTISSFGKILERFLKKNDK